LHSRTAAKCQASRDKLVHDEAVLRAIHIQVETERKEVVVVHGHDVLRHETAVCIVWLGG
jgi:hypothetical protein